MKRKFLLLFTLVLMLSVFVSSKGYSGCENPGVACNKKTVKSVSHNKVAEHEEDLLALSPIRTILLL
jgi:hypothetical protein